jgi:2-dehydropantoate 2-reductase
MIENSKRKIAVVGAGAIGSVLGGLLAHAGEDVTLVARKEHVDAIHQSGLRIEGALGAFTVPVRAAEALDFRPDLVLLSVKTQDVATACEQMKPNARDVPIITLQNGVRSDDIVASFFPKEYILSAVVMFNGQYLKPGQVTYGGGGPLVIGEAFTDNGPRVREIAELLRRAIPTEVSDNIRGAHWTKLLQNNLGNGLEAITGLPVIEVMRDADVRKIGLLSVKESYQVIKKAGFRPGPLPGLIAPVLLLARAPLSVGMWMLSKSGGSVKSVVGSTVQSLRRGRTTEIDYLNGEIVRLGKEIGIETPFNSKVVEMVKEVERSGRFYPPEELVRRFSIRRPRS